MGTNELMIGDWVFDKANECYWQHNIKDYRCENRILCDFEPIPLTPEILEKNGFKKQACEGWEFDGYRENSGLVYKVLWRNDCSTPLLMIDSFSREYGTYSSFNISSLHQLQHALKLCGIEKEIVL